MSDNEETLLKFPCQFPIKVMGKAGEGFDLLVAEIIRRHAPDLAEGAIQTRPSSGGKYIAITVTITAHSKAQIDAIYRELTGHERVLMAL